MTDERGYLLVDGKPCGAVLDISVDVRREKAQVPGLRIAPLMSRSANLEPAPGDARATDLLAFMLRVHDAGDLFLELEGRPIGTIRNPSRIRTDREDLVVCRTELEPVEGLVLEDPATGEAFVPDVLEFRVDEAVPSWAITAGRIA